MNLITFPEVLLLRVTLYPLIAQPTFVLGIAPAQLQDLALGIAELEILMGTSQTYQGASEWQPISSASAGHHTAWCHPQAYWRCTQSYCLCHQQ